MSSLFKHVLTLEYSGTLTHTYTHTRTSTTITSLAFLSWKEKKNQQKQLQSWIHTNPQSVGLKPFVLQPPQAKPFISAVQEWEWERGRAPARLSLQPAWASLSSAAGPLRCASARSKESLSIFSPHWGSTELLYNWHLGPAIILPLIYFTEFRLRWGFWAERAKDAEECLSEFTAAWAIFYEALPWPSGSLYCPFLFSCNLVEVVSAYESAWMFHEVFPSFA